MVMPRKSSGAIRNGAHSADQGVVQSVGDTAISDANSSGNQFCGLDRTRNLASAVQVTRHDHASGYGDALKAYGERQAHNSAQDRLDMHCSGRYGIDNNSSKSISNAIQKGAQRSAANSSCNSAHKSSSKAAQVTVKDVSHNISHIRAYNSSGYGFSNINQVLNVKKTQKITSDAHNVVNKISNNGLCQMTQRCSRKGPKDVPNSSYSKQPSSAYSSGNRSAYSSVHSSVQSSAQSSAQSSVQSSARKSVRKNVRNSVHNSVQSSVHNSTYNSVHNSVRNSAHNSAHNSASNSVRNSVHSSAYKIVRNSAHNSFQSSAHNSAQNSAQNSVRNSAHRNTHNIDGNSDQPIVADIAYINKKRGVHNGGLSSSNHNTDFNSSDNETEGTLVALDQRRYPHNDGPIVQKAILNGSKNVTRTNSSETRRTVKTGEQSDNCIAHKKTKDVGHEKAVHAKAAVAKLNHEHSADGTLPNSCRKNDSVSTPNSQKKDPRTVKAAYNAVRKPRYEDLHKAVQEILQKPPGGNSHDRSGACSVALSMSSFRSRESILSHPTSSVASAALIYSRGSIKAPKPAAKRKGRPAKPGAATSDVHQRVASARRLRMRTYQNQLNVAEQAIQDLIAENRLLKTLHKRQECALKKYEATNAELPKLLHSHSEEQRMWHTKYRNMQASTRDLQNKIKRKDSLLATLQERSKYYAQLNKDKQLGERQRLSERLRSMEKRLERSESEAKLLSRKLEIEEKNSKKFVLDEQKKNRDLMVALERTRIELNGYREMRKESKKYDRPKHLADRHIEQLVAASAKKANRGYQKETELRFDAKGKVQGGLKTRQIFETDDSDTVALEEFLAAEQAALKKTLDQTFNKTLNKTLNQTLNKTEDGSTHEKRKNLGSADSVNQLNNVDKINKLDNRGMQDQKDKVSVHEDDNITPDTRSVGETYPSLQTAETLPKADFKEALVGYDDLETTLTESSSDDENMATTKTDFNLPPPLEVQREADLMGKLGMVNSVSSCEVVEQQKPKNIFKDIRAARRERMLAALKNDTHPSKR